jgi:hypothetical protein
VQYYALVIIYSRSEAEGSHALSYRAIVAGNMIQVRVIDPLRFALSATA